MKKSTRRATMRQIAEMAGVSAMTVSKALADKPGVSGETRERIREIARNLDYLPNTLATSFRTNRTDSVGVVMSPDFDPVFPELFSGIEAAASARGLGTFLGNTGGTRERERAAVHMLVSKMVDGLLLTAPRFFNAREKRLLDDQGVPCVLIMCSHADPSITTVRSDDFLGGFAMAEYLIKSGGKRFLFMALEEPFPGAGERLRGWQAALREHGVPGPAPVGRHASTIEAGHAGMREAIRRGIAWDTVVCGSDSIAIGAIEALVEAGVAIPGRVRVAGYDGIQMSGHLRIPLTTMQQPLREIGETGMRLLAERIADPAAPAQQAVLESRLVVRESA